MQSILHRAETRGHANHGFLDTHHTFSFASYYDPNRMHFGALRVLNDDLVKGGGGFGTHPHNNMEIVSIPLLGDLQHRDSMGNGEVIRQGDIQVMSAGIGITHSEFNPNADRPVNFLQIWIIPNAANVKPRYEQQTFAREDRKNRLQTVVSPDRSGLWLHQDAWFSLGHFDAGFSGEYTLHAPHHGVYAFVISGDVEIGGETLHRRDGIGLWETDKVTFQASSETELLLIEVPMA